MKNLSLGKSTVWFARISVLLVFAINVQCALSFLIFPDHFLGAYELNGVSGKIAIQGLAIAFLMWNTTYPLVIVHPEKYRTLYVVILAQQLIGLIGETILFLTIPVGHVTLSASILRFILFDGVGLVLMGIAFGLLVRALKKGHRSTPHE